MTWTLYTIHKHPYTIINQGIVPTGYFSCASYLSVDNVYSSDDLYFGGGSISALAPGASAILDTYFNTTFKVQPGSYFLILVVDSGGNVKETDEANNVFVSPSPIILKPSDVDLSLSDLSYGKTTFAQYEQIVPVFNIHNSGSDYVNVNVPIEFFISADAIYSADDLAMEWTHLKVLDRQVVSSTADRSFSIFIPVVNPGDYYLIAIVDGGPRAGLYEADETNNSIAQPVKIIASDVDLEVVSVTNVVDNGSRMGADVMVRNNGTTGVGGYEFSVALSQGRYRISSMLNLKQTNPDTYLGPGQTRTLSIFFGSELASNVAPAGYHTLGFTINPYYPGIKERAGATTYNNQMESSETVYIQPPLNYNLNLIGLEAQGDFDDATTTLRFNVTFKNAGNVDATARKIQFTIRDEANGIGFQQDISIDVGPPGTTKTVSVALPLGKPLLPGNYTLGFYGYWSNIYYYGIDTKFSIQSKTYDLTGKVQGEDGTAVTKGNLFLYKKTESGLTIFVQQAKLTDGNAFKFTIDKARYTLYFIPDSSVFRGYIPTVYGKTVILKESSYFSTTSDIDVTFEMLKINPLPVGQGVINGRVVASTEIPGGRSGDDVSPLGSTENYYRIVLLSAEGNVVGYTITDEYGNFRFKDLPRTKYQLYLTRELDQPQMTEPLDVDLSTRNLTVNLTVGTNVSHELKTLMLPQAIQFAALPQSRYGDVPASLAATSDSGLPVVLISDDPSVAEIVDGQLIIRHVGVANITATQPGDAFYNPASQVTQGFTITKGIQSIFFPEIMGTTSHASTFALEAISTSGLDIIFTSDNEMVATIYNNVVTVLGPGETNITASQPGSENYEAAEPVTRKLSVASVGVENPLGNLTFHPNPATSTVQFENATIIDAIQLFNAVGSATRAKWDGHQLDIRDLAPGLYLMKVYSGATFGVFKIVKE